MSEKSNYHCPQEIAFRVARQRIENNRKLYNNSDSPDVLLGWISLQQACFEDVQEEHPCPGETQNEGEFVCPLSATYELALLRMTTGGGGGIPLAMDMNKAITADEASPSRPTDSVPDKSVADRGRNISGAGPYL